jgi:DNA-binding MarR family transcriptional regulator
LLRVVQRASEPPTIGTVAEVLAIDPSTASRVVDRVVEDGLLERRACDRDRRRARLRVTEDGLELLAELTRRRRELLREITQDWEGDELDRLVGLLERLQDGFDRLERAR